MEEREEDKIIKYLKDNGYVEESQKSEDHCRWFRSKNGNVKVVIGIAFTKKDEEAVIERMKQLGYLDD